MSKVIENKNKLLNIQRLLFIVLLIEIILIGIITRGSGDTGAYVSFVYQYSIGNIPYLDFWYQQGIAYPMILSIPVKLFGSGLLVHRIIFIFLSMSCLYVFYRMLIDLEINIVENIKFKIMLLIIGILSVDFWNISIRVGTKSALVILLLMLSIFSLSRYTRGGKLKDLILTCFFSATLISTKMTFLGVYLTFNAVIVLYGLKSKEWIKSVIIYNLCFLSFIAIWHIEILLQPDGLNQFKENFYLTKQTYDQNIYSIGDKIRQTFRFIHYLILKYLPFVLILNMNNIRKQMVGLFNNRNQSLILISLITSIIYLLTNVLMLFPALSTPHYDVLFPLFLLVIIFFSRNNISKVSYSSFALIFILLFCVNFGLAFRKGPLHYGRFTTIRPSMLKYEYGRNEVVDFLDQLESKGYNEYIYFGRRNHQVITTILKERPESASGTSPIPNGKKYGLTEKTANQLGLIDVSNIRYILNYNKVIVVEKERLIGDLNRRDDYKYDDFLIELDNTGYSNHFSDEFYDIYIKDKL